jgi:hypothetical protein
MISVDDRRVLQPVFDWCMDHPEHNLTPGALQALYHIPESTIRSWVDNGALPGRRDDGSCAWPTENMEPWLAVYGGQLATLIRGIRTKRSLRETRGGL